MSGAVKAPSYIPAPYKFKAEAYGDSGVGFPGDPSQTSFLYTRSWDSDDVFFPLTIHISAHKNAQLMGTEGQSGKPISVSGSEEHGTYHDGIWQPGVGHDERRFGSVVIHWSRGEVHSLTLPLADRSLGVRGARTRGIGLPELLRVLESML